MKGKIINKEWKVIDSIIIAKTYSNWIKGSGDQVSAIGVTRYLCENIKTGNVTTIDPLDIDTISDNEK